MREAVRAKILLQELRILSLLALTKMGLRSNLAGCGVIHHRHVGR